MLFLSMMRIFLNYEQSRSLAGFFMDIAKGLVLGGIGFSISAPFEIKIVFMFGSIIISYWCIKLALILLANNL